MKILQNPIFFLRIFTNRNKGYINKHITIWKTEV